MAFCEQCGAKLSPGVRFCEECGASVEVETPDLSVSLPVRGNLCKFSPPTWQNAWKDFAQKAGNNDIGLIVTRESALLKQLNGSAEKMKTLLDDFIANSFKRGVSYAYCDLKQIGCASPDHKPIVKFLKDMVDIARPKYLFILGNEEIVDVITWDDPTYDDNAVESDLCYSTLDIESPVNGQRYDFDSVMRVGRLPTHQGEAFSEFEEYFKLVSEYSGKIGKVRSYGLSALVWEGESNDEYGAIASSKVDVSPEVNLDTVRDHLPSDANLLFFNLHGSDSAECWQAHEKVCHTKRYRMYVQAFRKTGLETAAYAALRNFVARHLPRTDFFSSAKVSHRRPCNRRSSATANWTRWRWCSSGSISTTCARSMREMVGIYNKFQMEILEHQK